MDALKQWAVCLIISALAGTFVMVVSPKGSMDKTLRAVVGIFVVAAICSPLAELKNADFSLEAMVGSYSAYENENISVLQEQMISACRNAVENEVRKAADEVGAVVSSIRADVSVDAENCIIIHNISVGISEYFKEDATALSEALGERLGVPVTVNA